MALDAATLALTAAELKRDLIDARIDKIFQPTRDEVLLTLRSRKQSFRLLLSARSGSARVCVTGENYENPDSPPSYCMLLRKHLVGGRLTDIRTLPGERIVFFDFICTNEMGDLVENTMAAELMGRYCNLVLFTRPYGEDETNPTEGKIIDALKRVDFEASEIRQLLPGLPYTLPPRPDKKDFLSWPLDGLGELLQASPASVGDLLRKSFGGIGPVVAREACFRGIGPIDLPADSLTGAQVEKLAAAIEEIREDFATGGKPNLVKKPPAHATHTRNGAVG